MPVNRGIDVLDMCIACVHCTCFWPYHPVVLWPATLSLPACLPGVLHLQVHVLLLGAPWWPAAHEDWPKMIPTITLMSTIPPMMLLLLKGLLVLPPASIMLNRVRSGADHVHAVVVGPENKYAAAEGLL